MAGKNDNAGDKSRKICFVGLDNYAFLRPDLKIPDMGGGEAVQHCLLARQFVALGHDVSTVVLDYGQTDDEEIDGIKIVKAHKPGAGIKGLRFFHPRMSGVWGALRRADADIYYQSPAGALTGITAAYCRLHDKKFIFRIASDANCIPGKQLIRFWRDRKIYESGLRKADIRAVQTKRQKALLSRHYGLNSVIVNMVAERAEVDGDVRKTIDVLWVNHLRGVKRPDRFIQVARSLPEYSFVMIGGASRGSEDLFGRIEREAAQTPNIKFLGSRPYSYVNDCLARSKLLLNTSDLEGFPNTFLQAWMRGVPVATMFDPDDVVKSHKLGAATGKSEELPYLIKQFLVNDQLLGEYSTRAAEFARRGFSAEAVVHQYLKLIA